MREPSRSVPAPFAVIDLLTIIALLGLLAAIVIPMVKPAKKPTGAPAPVSAAKS